MKLRRIRLESFRRFRAQFEIAELQDGLNLFAAPNESGKSTIAAAIRAAFQQRHRSNVGETFKPWGDSTGSPTIDIEFELGGKPARLLKRFLAKKTCELQIDGRRFEGAEAEDHLAELLGYSYAGKGASDASDHGIPGLLWIEQGTSHHVGEAVSHASDHLRNALGSSLAELTATAGDAIIKAVKAERDELLTASKDTPKGVYAEAIKAVATLEAEQQRLSSEIATYQGDVDRLARLRREHAKDAQDQPWVGLRRQLEGAKGALEQAQGLEGRKVAKTAEVQAATSALEMVRAQLKDMQDQEAAGERREKDLLAARAQVESTQGQVNAWEPRHTDAAKALDAARAALDRARTKARLEAQRKAVEALDAKAKELADKVQAATAEHELAVLMTSKADATKVAPAAIQRVNQCAQELATARAHLDAAATTLVFDLTSPVTIDGQSHIGTGRATLLRTTDIDIPGVGRISVLPGGSELAEISKQHEALRLEMADLLSSHGVSTAAELSERDRQSKERARDAEEARRRLKLIAPKGLEDLAQQLSNVEAQLTAARSLLQSHAETDASGSTQAEESPGETSRPLMSVDEAEALVNAATDVLTLAADSLNSAKLALASAQSQLASATEERDALLATLNAPERATRRQALSNAMVDAAARASALQAELDALRESLKTLNLKVLEQDVTRFESSVKNAEQAHQVRASEMNRLSALLEVKGATGLEEREAEVKRDLELARRRSHELERRAKALDHLLRTLQAKRDAVAQRLRAPLQKHLSHYLNMLFQGARVEIGEDLAPERLIRTLAGEQEDGEFVDFSMGAREQLGIASRLAYADLLKEAGKPTLLLLDDALVHTDDDRLQAMQRLLYDAAQRHQILLFTCHPSAWASSGVAARGLAS